MFRKGDKVYWHDPEGLTSDYAQVVDAKRQDIIDLKTEHGSEVEAPSIELEHVSQRIPSNKEEDG